MLFCFAGRWSQVAQAGRRQQATDSHVFERLKKNRSYQSPATCDQLDGFHMAIFFQCALRVKGFL
jgi:hypothetical protein